MYFYEKLTSHRVFSCRLHCQDLTGATRAYAHAGELKDYRKNAVRGGGNLQDNFFCGEGALFLDLKFAHFPLAFFYLKINTLFIFIAFYSSNVLLFFLFICVFVFFIVLIFNFVLLNRYI